MKKTMLIIVSLINFIWCCKKESNSYQANTTPNTTTIIQDSRLIGGWRLDSMLWGTTMSYSTGNGSLTDSVYFSEYGFNGNIPVSDIHSYFISGNTITPLPTGYFWDTSNIDSLYLRVGNHSQDASSAYKFSVNGNKMILTWSVWTLNQYLLPPNPRVAISYYHK